LRLRYSLVPKTADKLTYPFVIDARIEKAARDGAIFALNLSGGKDSTMSAHAASKILDDLGHDRNRRILIHADLGRAEWRSTPCTVKRQAAEIGLPLITVRRTAGDMVSRWEQRYEQGWDLYAQLKLARLRGPWSAASQRFCTAELKRDVLHRYLAATFAGQTIVSVLGIRHQESTGRSSTPISKIDGKLARADGTNGILWHPSIHVTTDEVFHYHREFCLTLHEAYDVYGATRLSCAFCVLASKQDITISAGVTANHDLYRLLVEIEARTGFSFQQGGWLADVAPSNLDADLLARVQAAKAYAAERRLIEAQIPKEFLKTPKGSKWPTQMPSIEAANAIAQARRLNAAWTGRNLSFVTVAQINDEFRRVISSNCR
jgi:3'-phosphoadenosine 5'-phosphosulfate sulfotransferase (PAPS reductase)/FAD synthetase